MLRIDGRVATELQPTQFDEQDLQEDDIREWVIDNPREVLGEDLLVIGREVGVTSLNDGIDVLALDRSGNSVIVELKRGTLRGTVDFQVLKYASYVSRWSYDDIKQQFEKFRQSKWGSDLYGEDATFQETVQQFCDDDYEVNAEQRLVLVGNQVRERIGSVVLWLREQDIDARIVELSLFHDEAGELYLDSKTLVPTSDLEKFETGDSPSDKPWEVDGKRWHLEERTNEDTAVLVQKLVDTVGKLENFDGPSWTQKVYIAFRIDGTNRVLLRTLANSVRLDIHDFEVTDEDALLTRAAEVIGDPELVELDTEFHGNRQRLRLKCRPDDDVDVDSLTDLIYDLVLAS
jgi:uncharacterized protein (DUF1778 family)